jgi:hypothetical protein
MSCNKRPDSTEQWQESDLFAAFRSACKTNDPKQVLSSLMAWLGDFCKTQQHTSIKQFSQLIGTTQLAEQLTTLRKAVDSPVTGFSGEDVFRAVEQALFEFRKHRSPVE